MSTVDALAESVGRMISDEMRMLEEPKRRPQSSDE